MATDLEKWLDVVAVSVLGYRTTLVATLELCRSLIQQDVLGDFVECGVYAGAEVAVMAKAIMLYGGYGGGGTRYTRGCCRRGTP